MTWKIKYISTYNIKNINNILFIRLIHIEYLSKNIYCGIVINFINGSIILNTNEIKFYNFKSVKILKKSEDDRIKEKVFWLKFTIFLLKRGDR